MNVDIVGRVRSTLPADDDHPYRTGAWQPNFVEYDATDLDVIGEIPVDLDGVYLRNTENPVHPSIDRLYHPFDGDGMLHMLRFRDGRAEYRNRFVRTAGFEAEQAAGGALWSGILGGPEQSLRPDGWGARTRMKDASSTDVVVHAGRALTSFYQCGDLYSFDPATLEPLGRETWNGTLPDRLGNLRAHQDRPAHGRDARVQLLEVGAVHALRSGRRGPRARALGRRAAPRSAAPARHGVHGELRDPERLPVVLGRRAPRQGRARPALPARPSDPFRGDPAARHDRRRAVVRGEPHLRAALVERVRGRRRDRPRRLLPARSDAGGRRRDRCVPARVPRDRHAPHADRVHAVADEPRDRRVHRGDALGTHDGVPDDQPEPLGPPVPVHLQHDDAPGLVPVRRRGEGRPPHGCGGPLRVRRRACSAARRRWRPE